MAYEPGTSACRVLIDSKDDLANALCERFSILECDRPGDLCPALVDLIDGSIDWMFMDPIAALEHIRSGKIRGLAVGAADKVQAIPELPSMKEAGIDGVDVVGNDDQLGLLVLNQPGDVVQPKLEHVRLLRGVLVGALDLSLGGSGLSLESSHLRLGELLLKSSDLADRLW